MQENKKTGLPTEGAKGFGGFLHDFLAGVCIGVAFIIPGFSGGSVAAILGIYEKIINAVANLFKEFKKSVVTLIPIGLGLVAGAVALLYPLSYFLVKFPLPTVSIFVGLAIGGLPSMLTRVKGKPDANNIAALSVPLVLAFMLCFIPSGQEVDLFAIGFGGFILLFLVGILGSCALVVPGISGSMLLLILGYYKPLVALVTEHLFKFKDLGRSILVLGTCALGIAVGFFLISVLMKQLLAKYPRGTFFAILGFIIGSLPAVYVSTMKDAGMISSDLKAVAVPTAPAYYFLCIFLVFVGVSISYYVSTLAGGQEEKE